MSLRVAVDLRGLPGANQRPRGPSRWARRLATLMVEHAGDAEVRFVERDTPPGPTDVVISLGPTLRPPARPGVPTLAAVYDLSHLVAPRTHGWLERVRRGWLTALLTRRVDGLLAPSHAIARALVDYLRVPGDQLTWIPTIGPGWRRSPRAETAALRAELGLNERYLLFVGTLSPRKNLPTLLAAWDRVCTELGARVELVVAGDGAADVAGATVSGRARYLGPLPDEKLVPLLSGALAWVCPSLAEGCSIGAVEAMAAGAPPIVAAGTALSDIVGGAGMVLPPHDVDAWASAIRHVVNDVHDRNRMAARGLRAVAELREADAARRALTAAAAATGSRI